MKKVIFTIIFCFFASLAISQGNNCPAFCLSSTSNFTWTPSGIGVQELNASNRGCLTSEHQSVWLSISILTSGTINMRINPSVNTDDFDFALW